MVIRTESLTKLFGGVSAVENVDFELGDDELCAVIGPNGAGKTTFFNLLTGTVEPSSGKVELLDDDIWLDVTEMSVDEVASHGVHRSYQVTNLFPSSTVLENVRVATQRKNSFKLWRNVGSFGEDRKSAEDILDFVGLKEYAEREAQGLSHAEKRRLELGVALGGDPKLLLLDEPTAGVSSGEVDEMTGLIERVAEEHHVMFIEHNMDVVMDVSDRVVVFNRGNIIADGEPEDVKDNEAVQEAYLSSSSRGSSSTRRGGRDGTP